MADTGGSAGSEEPRDRRKAELEELFADWDQRQADATVADAPAEESFFRSSRLRINPVHALASLTVLVAAVAAVSMWVTRYDFAYWLKRNDPVVDAGNLAERWKQGERKLDIPSNSWIKVDGLASTYEAEGTNNEGEKTRNYFLCPFFDLIVLTKQDFPEKPVRGLWGLEVEAGLEDLLLNKRALPEDLVAFISGNGRLVKADQAPRWAAAPIRHYSRLLGIDPHQAQVFIDGEKPQDFGMFAAIWFVAPLAPLISLLVFLRSWRRRRRARA